MITVLALSLLTQSKVTWETNLDKGLATAKAAGKPVLLHFMDPPRPDGPPIGGGGFGKGGGVGYGSAYQCAFCEVPLHFEVASRTDKFVCVRINPNQKPYTGMFKGSELARILDPFGKQVEAIETPDNQAVGKRLEDAIVRFGPKDIPWTEDYKAAIGAGKMVAVVFTGADTEKDVWLKFFGSQVMGYPMESFTFVKVPADSEDAKPFNLKTGGTLLLLDPSAKDFEKKPMERTTTPPKPGDFAGMLYKAIGKFNSKPPEKK
jgi:hypothetical protein